MHVSKGVFGAIMLGLGSTLGTGVFVSIRIGAGVTGPAVIIIIILAALLAAWLRPGSASRQDAVMHTIASGRLFMSHS